MPTTLSASAPAAPDAATRTEAPVPGTVRARFALAAAMLAVVTVATLTLRRRTPDLHSKSPTY